MTTLTLGTASFGMPGYGIASRHRCTWEEALLVLGRARLALLAVDTAAAYGNAEELVGIAGAGPPLTTKILPGLAAHPRQLIRAIEGQVRASRERLALSPGVPLTVLFHTPAHGAAREYVAALRECRDGLGLCSSIGTSIYDPEEYAALVPGQDVVQLPYSALDRRCEAVIRQARDDGLTVQARAPFCQGLLLLDPTQAPARARPLLEAFRAVCARHSFGLVEAALRFALDGGADTVVFGVDDPEQLAADLDIWRSTSPDWPACREALRAAIPQADAAVVNPSLWSRS